MRHTAVPTWDSLHGDRAYKEEHRSALTVFHRKQVQQRPWLPDAQFLHVVQGAPGVHVLLITGMRDESPVAALSHLVPCSRLLEVRVNASEDTREARREHHRINDDRGPNSKPRGERMWRAGEDDRGLSA